VDADIKVLDRIVCFH